ncbi:MAG TPA: carboxypeptidase-like regulatory domain-containing protein [Methanotrichaceae archaeon]|nr:carboxypeptidase-like regulatory domain-containing protein [Methanotrichaceae archaeon]
MLLIGAGSSLAQLSSSNYDYLGTPVYYSNTQHIPGMPLSQPSYVAPYPSAYYANQINYIGGDPLGTPIYYSDTQHLPGMPYGQSAYVAPYAPSYYYGFNPYSTITSGPASILTGFGLAGRVVDPSGNGIAGAQVILTNIYESGTFSTTTNSLGYYGINAPNGVYYVTASLPGYSFSQSVSRMVNGFASAALNIVGTPTYGAMPASSYSAQSGMPTTSSSAAYGTTTATTPTTTPTSTGYSSGAGGY